MGKAKSFIMPSMTVEALSSLLTVSMTDTVKNVPTVVGKRPSSIEIALAPDGPFSSHLDTDLSLHRSRGGVSFFGLILSHLLNAEISFRENAVPFL